VFEIAIWQIASRDQRMGTVTHQHGVRAESSATRTPTNVKQRNHGSPMGNPETDKPSSLPFSLGACAIGLVVIVWAYGTTLTQLLHRWGTDAQYSHGYFVPLFGIVYMWLKRQNLNPATLRSNWLGIGLLLLGCGLRLAGTYFYYDWFDQLSIIPTLAGMVLAVGGWGMLLWSLPAIGFLVFMIPLPYRLEVAMAHPLQRMATIASTYLMQTIGLPAISEGNVILLNEFEIGVVEACSGLRMLVIFFAISTGAALLIDRPLWERLVIIISAVPIALISNILRISVTGILHETVGSEIANRVFHDLAGWLMMPVALGILWVQLKLMSHLLVTPEGPRHIQIAPQALRVGSTKPYRRSEQQKSNSETRPPSKRQRKP
jgi:exosortase